MNALAQFLRAELASKGWDQLTFANHSGIAASTISRVLRGKFLPKRETLAAFANALEIPVARLLDLTDTPVRNTNLSEDEQTLWDVFNHAKSDADKTELIQQIARLDDPRAVARLAGFLAAQEQERRRTRR